MRDKARPGRDGATLEGIADYWEKYAQAFAAPLGANGLIGNFVRNSAVTGAYAEAWIRQFAARMLPGLRVSTGAIVRTTDDLHNRDLSQVPQIDLIIWDPTELPPLFEMGDFGLIHVQAARAIIEVKRSLRSRKELVKQLESQRMRLLATYRRNVIGVVVSSGLKTLFAHEVTPEWVANSTLTQLPAMIRLLKGPGGPVDVDGLFALVYFLSHVARLTGGHAA